MQFICIKKVEFGIYSDTTDISRNMKLHIVLLTKFNTNKAKK